MFELLWVQPGRNDGRVALAEEHTDHPDGAAWVASTGVPVQVALTLLVERKLANGDLVAVDAPAPVVKEKPKRKTREEVQREIEAAGGVAVGDEDAPKRAVPRRTSKPGIAPGKGKST